MSEIDASLSQRWIPVPDAAEEMGTDFRTLRNKVRDGHVIALSIPGETGPRIAEEFLTGEAPSKELLDGLRGSITQLRDCGLDDTEAVTWLLTPNDELGSSPAEALATGLKHAVRRAAISLAF